MAQEIKTVTIKVGDEDRVVEVRKPTPKIEAEANMAASKVFAKLVKEKGEDGKAAFILRSQLNTYLANIGIYSEEDIDDINTFSERIKELEEFLSKGGKKKSEGKKAAIELRQFRYGIYVLLARQSEFDKNTVEHYADNARMDYLITKCICYEGGIPVFKNVAEYESDKDMQELMEEPIKILAGIVSQYDPDFEKKLPENEFLKKYNYCDDKYRLIDADGNLIDGNGDRVDEDGNKLEKVEKPVAVGEFEDDDEADIPAGVVPAESQDDIVSSDPVVEAIVLNTVIPADGHGIDFDPTAHEQTK